jgi:Mce-associated membrane protein
MTTTTTSPMTNLYDVLDVEPSSSPDEIRAAWRTAVAELDPTDRRFRVYNQAAEVLLDSRRRASYDEEFEHVATGPSGLPRSSRASSLRSRSGRSAAAPPRRDALTRAWLIVALAAATAVMLGYVGVTLTQPSEASVATDTDAAQAAAERAIVPILSYDARDLARSEARATALMTASEQEQYRRLFAVIRENAPRTGTVVRAQYVASGVVRGGTDQVDVLMFVNQRTTNHQHPKVPVVYKSQVTVTMVEVGGQWLVDGLHTTSTGS